MNKKPLKFLLGFLGFNLVLQIVLLLLWWSFDGFGGATQEMRYNSNGGTFYYAPRSTPEPFGFYFKEEYLAISLLVGLFGGIVTGSVVANPYDPEKERKRREYWRKDKTPKP